MHMIKKRGYHEIIAECFVVTILDRTGLQIVIGFLSYC